MGKAQRAMVQNIRLIGVKAPTKNFRKALADITPSYEWEFALRVETPRNQLELKLRRKTSAKHWQI